MASSTLDLLGPVRLRVALAVTAATLVAGGAATTASAGLGGLLAPVLAPCAGAALSQPFLPWSDSASYSLVGNGGFESGAAGWTVAGAAATAAGNESFDVASAADGRSLMLPAGSSATSPAACVGTLSPTMRFFARNTGAPGSTLRVDVVYTDALGLRWALPIATISGSTDWAPSPVALILANLTALPVLSGGAAQVSFRFVPLGAAGAWQIDDVYVDPYKGS